jgi:glucokinase
VQELICDWRMSYTVGLDLGGTKLAAALVDSRGKIISFKKQSILNLKSTTPHKAQNGIVNLMVQMIAELKSENLSLFKKLKGVGLASAGPLNVEKGILINPANFSGWKTVPIQEMLSAALKKNHLPHQVYFQNDAIAAALAEGWIGGAKGLKNFAVVTVGTGIGSGVIFNKRPLQFNGMGSEFGHIIVENSKIESASKLHFFTVEGIASGTAILRRAIHLGFKGFSIEELVSEMNSGKTQYHALFDDAADALAGLCYNLSIGLNLEAILFSGGLIKIRNLYFDRMKKRYAELIKEMNPAFQCPVQIAKCLNKAGVIGAAHLPYMK